MSYFQANIHSIMGSEDQVLNLMRLLDDGIRSAEKIEDKLDFYDSILQVLNESLFAIKKKNYENYFLPRKTYLKINCMILFLKHGGLNYKFHCNYVFSTASY